MHDGHRVQQLQRRTPVVVPCTGSVRVMIL